jgi:hypothetical protein
MTGNSPDIIISAVTGEGWTTKTTGRRSRPTREEIAQLAYDRYEARGRQDGNDVDDWLLAERELIHHYA